MDTGLAKVILKRSNISIVCYETFHWQTLFCSLNSVVTISPPTPQSWFETTSSGGNGLGFALFDHT